MTILPTGGPAIPVNARKEDPARIQEAAQQFEALLINEMLKTVRQGSEGFLGTGDDQAGAMAMDVAMEQFASSLAAQGGLGISRLVTQGLKSQTDAAKASNLDSSPR